MERAAQGRALWLAHVPEFDAGVGAFEGEEFASEASAIEWIALFVVKNLLRSEPVATDQASAWPRFCSAVGSWTGLLLP